MEQTKFPHSKTSKTKNASMTYRMLLQHEEEGRVSWTWILRINTQGWYFFAPHLFKIKYKTNKEPLHTNAYRCRPRRVQFSLANGHMTAGVGGQPSEAENRQSSLQDNQML